MIVEWIVGVVLGVLLCVATVLAIREHKAFREFLRRKQSMLLRAEVSPLVSVQQSLPSFKRIFIYTYTKAAALHGHLVINDLRKYYSSIQNPGVTRKAF